MKRALSVADIKRKNYKTIKFEGKWKESLGELEAKGTWLIWGHSTNGKSSFAMQLAKEISKDLKVGYVTFEEHNTKSLQDHVVMHHMDEVKSRFKVLPDDNIEDLTKR